MISKVIKIKETNYYEQRKSNKRITIRAAQSHT